MKNKIIIANWKMNPPTFKGAELLFNSFKKEIKNIKDIEIIICPPFIYLEKLIASASAKGYGGLAFGSQNCFWENQGAYTGEISPVMLKKLGAEYVIIGHSERRNYLGETDEIINKKVLAAFKAGLKVILCVGETKKGLEEAKNYISQQLKENLRGVRDQLIIAYEPVWAIGTGNYCQPKDALEMINYIKKIVSDFACPPKPRRRRGFRISDFRVLYGGSVDSKNIVSYISYPEIAGALVGGASLKIDEFKKIINEVSKTIKSQST